MQISLLAVLSLPWFTTVSVPSRVVPPVRWCDSSTIVDPLPVGGHQVTLVACGVTPVDSATRQQTFASVGQALILYGRLTGVHYPWSYYTMEFLPSGNTGGQATSAHIAFDVPLPDVRAAHDRPDITGKILAHELAHQWGSRGGQGGKDSGWLGEGFADFMAAQVWGATGGARAEEDFLFFYNSNWDDSWRLSPAVNLLTTLGAPYGWYSIPWPGAKIWERSIDQDDYYRGALVLWMLQQYLGDTHFWAVMHTYLTDSTGTGDANATFLRAIRTVTGEDLTWFFHEWIHGRSYPRFTVSATYDAKTRRVILHVQQAAPTFRMPVTIRVGTSRGDIVSRATVDAPSQTLVVKQVSGPPTYIVFDDGDAIVKTLDFPQPTAWLVAQARREARPWQTWWAIEQLRSRAGHDPSALATLVAEARQGQYALTRAQALVALGAFSAVSPDVAHGRPELLTAMTMGTQDTAVIVRRAAARALAVLGTPAAWMVERTVFTHDASDLVRAEALQSLLMTQAIPLAEHQTLFSQALRWSPSYRDIVPLAAVQAVALTGQCDTTMVGIIQTTLHEPEIVATLQRVTGELTNDLPVIAPNADATCLQTIAAQLPLPSK